MADIWRERVCTLTGCERSEFLNREKFLLLDCIPPEGLLNKEIYTTVVEICKPQFEEEKKSIGVSSSTDKKYKFKIDL